MIITDDRPVKSLSPVSAAGSQPAAERLGIKRCNHALPGGRTCCHVKDAPLIRYLPCSDIHGPEGGDRCYHPVITTGKPHRHSHSWQLGEARYGVIGGQLINMETGEVAGYTGGLGGQVIGDITTGPFHYKPELDPAAQANARRVLRLYGFDLPDDDYVIPVSDHVKAGIMVSWHYHGASGWSYGTDQEGHNYEMSPEGKLKRIYSLNERGQAVAFARQAGPAKAARKFDIPPATVRSWMSRG